MKIKVLISILLVLVLAGCGQPKATQTPVRPTAAPGQPVFEEASCPFELPYGQVEGRTVECGYLLVPENREDPDSATIRLAVAIFHHPDGASEPDPIIYLEGGPGGSSLELLYLTFDIVYAPLFEANRDIILFDQRGVGLSEPALDCPAAQELDLELLDSELNGEELSDEQAMDLYEQALRACEEDLLQVADLSAYNTVANAADVNDLRIALGYDKVNLWGISYGTRLALGVMRDFPEGVRSVVIDSVYPPDVDLFLETPANIARALDVLFAGCAADEACNAAYPDLRTVFFDTVAYLNENPAHLSVTHMLNGETYPVLLDGDSLIGLVFQFLYDSDIIPSLPQIIYQTAEGNFDQAMFLFGSFIAQYEAISGGMQHSVECNEEAVFGSAEDFQAMMARFPELNGLFEDSLMGERGYAFCAEWDSGEAGPLENEPVTSDIPTLVLAGEYDPITPPAWARRAAETLSNGYVFEFPGTGHGASVGDDCPVSMVISFFQDPSKAPDDSCMASMGAPDFVVASAGGETVELVPFTDDLMGLSGVVPAGWKTEQVGFYSRESAGVDAAVLLIQSAPLEAEQFLDLFAGQIGLDEVPAPDTQRDANGLTWSLYALNVQGLSLDIALAQTDGLTLLVVLQSAPYERDSLYESVFLPVVDELVPIP